jgi:hypothetical protein
MYSNYKSNTKGKSLGYTLIWRSNVGSKLWSDTTLHCAVYRYILWLSYESYSYGSVELWRVAIQLNTTSTVWYCETCQNRTYLGQASVFEIDRCSLYTDSINKDFLHCNLFKIWFIHDSSLFRIRFVQRDLQSLLSIFCFISNILLHNKHIHEWHRLAFIASIIMW